MVFYPVKVFRQRGQQRIVADTIYDDWLCVGRFPAGSFRAKVNMALLREAIENRSLLAYPCTIFDLIEINGVNGRIAGFLLAVDPHAELDMVEDFVDLLTSTGTVSDEAMAEALDEEIQRRWRQADIYTRLVWLDQTSDDPEAVLELYPPDEVYDLIKEEIT